MAGTEEIVHPVRRIPGDPEEDSPEPGIALCLSGGGYRAMLFHLGALWRLNELGYLPRLDRVSSVSGGSIAAGVLALAWDKLAFDERGVSPEFGRLVAAPLRDLAGGSIDWKAVITGMLIPGQTVSERVAAAYKRKLFGDATLQDLPDQPRFVINSTNLQSGELWRFSKPYMWDWRVGRIDNPTFPLACAVAASSAFPPVLSPAVFEFKESDYTSESGDGLQKVPFTTRVVLSDGGVYDNLGLETAWKRCQTVLVSDGGGQMPELPRPARNWGLQSMRVLKTIDNQVRCLRKRQAIEGFAAQPPLRQGTYWGIRSAVSSYPLSDALECPEAATDHLAEIGTRLCGMKGQTQERLINWGYAICDAAMRSHVCEGPAGAPSFPYAGGVG
jgi:NTE family protein